MLDLGIIIYLIGSIIAVILLYLEDREVPEEYKCTPDTIIIYIVGGSLSWFTVILILISKIKKW